jgi:hypothetical protein
MLAGTCDREGCGGGCPAPLVASSTGFEIDIVLSGRAGRVIGAETVGRGGAPAFPNPASVAGAAENDSDRPAGPEGFGGKGGLGLDFSTVVAAA